MFTGNSRQLDILLGEADQYQHRPLYTAIVEMLRKEGCAGATVVRGVAGFGASSVLHTAAVLRLSMDMPVVITIIDRPERIERLLPKLREIAPNALMTAHDVEVVQSGIPFREGLPDVKVEEVMRREVVTVRPESPLTEVVELLLDRDFTAVPVVDSDYRAVGMISDNDLLTRGDKNIAISLQRAADREYVRALQLGLKDPARKVAEVMTREVVTAAPQWPLGRAAHLMVSRHLKRLPVVDSAGRLIGILGRLDILNTLSLVRIPQWHAENRSFGEQPLVRDVMSREPPAVHQSAQLGAIFELLLSSAYKRVVVVDDSRRVVGIIADSDLVVRIEPESRPGLIELLAARVPIERIGAEARKHVTRLRARRAAELMTREVVTVREDMPVASALALSAERRVKRLPAVDGEGRLTGIVGRTEMMRALLA
ncbi:MAG: DUF190 domain-containing protein [Candidatus Binataceae bacterium]